MRATWTDERLDELTHRMDLGFQRVDGEIRGLRAEMNARFDQVESRLGARFDQHGSRFDQVESRLGARLDRHDSRFDSMHQDMLAMQRTMIWMIGTIIAGLLVSIVGFVITNV